MPWLGNHGRPGPLGMEKKRIVGPSVCSVYSVVGFPPVSLGRTERGNHETRNTRNFGKKAWADGKDPEVRKPRSSAGPQSRGPSSRSPVVALCCHHEGQDNTGDELGNWCQRNYPHGFLECGGKGQRRRDTAFTFQHIFLSPIFLSRRGGWTSKALRPRSPRTLPPPQRRPA